MQFRAGVLYMALFVVIAVGTYGVAATAESPHVTADGVDADYTLEEGEEFEVDGQTFNVTQLGDGTGTAQYVNESAVLEVQWEDGGSVLVDEETEYTVVINQPEEGDGDGDGGDGGDAEGENETAEDEGEDGNASAEGGAEGDGDGGGDNESESGGEGESEEGAEPESFTLRESFDEEEYETFEREGETYVITDDGEFTHIDDFDEIDSQTYEVGDTVEFYDEDSEQMVEGEVVDLTADMVTVEYVGVEETDYDLEHGDTVTLNEQEFAVYVSGDQAQLSSNVEALEAQHSEVEEFNDRVRGLRWSMALSLLAAVVIGALAFMPVRG